MTRRERIYNKYNGLCAYSGTKLEDDWQIDHMEPVVRLCGKKMSPDNDNEENMYPSQKLINHYKHSLSLDDFRNWLLGGLHKRLDKLPKNTRVQKSINRKKYLLKIASYFGITPDKPFDRVFYFEKVKQELKS